VTKPDLGTKRLCANCGAKFYDLSKDPIICPKCATVFEKAPPPRGRPDASRAAPKETAAVEPEKEDVEFVSLEDAEAEAQGKKKVLGEDIDAEDDVEVEDDGLGDDDTFIEEQEEGDDDVADIIGERDEDEET
jgi:uncharacterized protein (TIGR02300 family)